MGGKSSTISTSEQRILSLQVQQSSQGLTLPVVYGRTRVTGNLVWYGDFTAIEHKTTTRQGGKGGGGVKQVDIKYTYEAAIAMALCEGPIKGVTAIWRDKEKFLNPSQLRLNVAFGTNEQPVWPHLLQAKHAAQALNYSDTAYLYSPNYELTSSAQIYSHNFEVDGKLGYSADIPDANPADILRDLLTNQNYGCGFPAENMGDLGVYSAYCRAAGIFLSPAYGEQSEAVSNIETLLQQTNSAAVYSQGRLKIIPYGDAPASGNGATYIPNLTPLYDLTDDDFIGDGEDPITVERKTNADAYNQVQVEYLNRANDYNIAVAEVKDQANIEQYGLRPQEAVEMHAICDGAVAKQVAQLLLQRALYVRNEYSFKLGWKYILLEPMDLVTLTDEALGLNRTPVRIIEIEEDEDGVLSVVAEDFPFGTATATHYPTQPSLGYSANYNISPGNAHAPVILEAPLQLTGGEPQIWLATAGGDNWGGAEVWVSTDGDSYVRVGAVHQKARFGNTVSDLPAGAVYDSVNTLRVQIGAGHLDNVTEQESRDFLTACYVDGEFIAYETAELTGVGAYTLGNLTRGGYGSDITEHKAGGKFARLDEALFRYTFDKNWLGRTVWIKLVSFNVFGSGMQELSEVPAYAYTIVGAPLGAISNLRLTSGWHFGKAAVITWDALDGADSYDVEVYAANSQTRLRSVSGLTANTYTYSQADMKQDGGQVRNVVFKVRARAVTGKTGSWTQVVAQNPQLSALTGIALDSGLKQAFFQCAAPQEEDFAGICIWISDNPSVPTTPANLAYDGRDTFVTLNKCGGEPLEAGKTYYIRAAGYDSFDKQGLNISSSHAFTVYEVSAIAKDLGESALNQALKSKINSAQSAEDVNAKISAEAAARAAALRQEAQARAAAVKKTADDAAKALTAKAREIGTEITRVEEKSDNAARTAETLSARLDGLQVGGRNLLSGSMPNWRDAQYSKRFALTEIPEVGETVTVTLWGELGEGRTGFGVYNSYGWGELAKLQKISDGVYRATFRWNAPRNGSGELENAASTHLNVYAYPSTATSVNEWRKIKLERGGVGSDWTIAPEDVTAAVEAEREARVEANQAEARARESLAAEFAGNTANALREIKAVADAQKVQTQSLETLGGRVGQAESNATKLTETVTKNHKATTDALNNLKSTVDGNAAEIGELKRTRTTRADVESVVDSKMTARFQTPDTRDDNQLPSWYYLNYPRQRVTEFKRSAVLSLGGGGYLSLETNVPWDNPTGGVVTQTAYQADGKVLRRRSQVSHTYRPNPPDPAKVQVGLYQIDSESWTEWKADETVDGAQAKADAVKRLAEAANALATAAQADLNEFKRTSSNATGAQAEALQELAAQFGRIKVGGRNYIMGSLPDADYWYFSKNGASKSVGRIENDGLVWEANGETSGVWKQWQVCGYAINGRKPSLPLNELQKGDVVTLSFECRSSVAIRLYYAFAYDVTKGSRVDGINSGVDIQKSDDWVRYSVTHTLINDKPEAYRGSRLLFNPTGLLGRNVLAIRKVKLEKGTLATDWTPAPEDGDAKTEATAAALEDYKKVEAAKDKATAESIQTIRTTVNGNSAAIQQQAKSIDGLEAQYTVKLDTNGHVAGFGLASTTVNSKPTSRFIVNADAFGVGATGQSTAFPFTVDTVRNRVGVDGDLVVNGKAIINRLNAGDIAGDKIQANSIAANRLQAGAVTARELAANAVTADKMQVTDLSAISANMGHVTAGTLSGTVINGSTLNAATVNGGHLNIGNGNFVVDWHGNLFARSGRFEGTVSASRIEGVMFERLITTPSGWSGAARPPGSRSNRYWVARHFIFRKHDARTANAIIQPFYAADSGYIRIMVNGTQFAPISNPGRSSLIYGFRGLRSGSKYAFGAAAPYHSAANMGIEQTETGHPAGNLCRPLPMFLEAGYQEIVVEVYAEFTDGSWGYSDEYMVMDLLYLN